MQYWYILKISLCTLLNSMQCKIFCALFNFPAIISSHTCDIASEILFSSLNCLLTIAHDFFNKPNASINGNGIRSKINYLKKHNLEKYLPSLKAVHIRRLVLNEQIISTNNSSFSLDLLPYEHYDYSLVTNQCCENVIGYVPLPVGYAGPLRVNNKNFFIPLATTEGIIFFFFFLIIFFSSRCPYCQYKSWM